MSEPIQPAEIPAQASTPTAITTAWWRRKGAIALAATLALVAVGGIISVASADDQMRHRAATSAPPVAMASTPSATASTAAATPSPSLTRTERPEKTATPLAKPLVFTGHGNKVIKFKAPLAEPRLMTTTWRKGNGNITVWAMNTNGEEEDLLINAIDTYKGQTLLNISDEEVAALKVEGGGTWKISLTDLPATVKRWGGKGTFTGKSDGVFATPDVFDPLDTIKFKSTRADSNVIVTAYADSGAELVVNEVGNFSGEYIVPNGTFLWTVESDGNWSFKRS